MTVSLHNLARHGDISWVSYYFAEFIARLDRSTVDELPGLSAALVSEANLAGHVCIELGRFEGRPLFKSSRLRDAELPRGIDSSSWRQRLEASVCAGSAPQRAPLTLDGERLYLNRFWYFEDFVANRIKAMLSDRRDEDPVEIQSLVDTLFADTSTPDPDQMNAVLTAAIKPFTVISGGPGSGKTSTVVRILALLLTLDPGCRVALAAPTGKAAARMIDSIRGRIDQLDIDSAVKRAIPEEARTIHRLLRYSHRGFDYDQQNPLPFDCVVIDEASMIDLKLTYHLLAALPPETRLILLGDRDQLSAVAAGNVLGDITGHGLDISDAPIAASIALLGSSYRFDSESAIGEIAQLVNRGERNACLELLRQSIRGLHWHENNNEELDPVALAWLVEAFQPVFDSDSPAVALAVFESVRILSCTNLGSLGSDALNRLISSEMLARNNLPAAELFSGLPIMITRNRHELGLFNGDTGILWQCQDGLRACFRDSDGGIRELSLYRLPKFTPAWASTVHKSQGSEFDSVMLVLPVDPESETLSRELLYTAITRARRQFILHGSEAAAETAIRRITRRHSGLAHKLGWT